MSEFVCPDNKWAAIARSEAYMFVFAVERPSKYDSGGGMLMQLAQLVKIWHVREKYPESPVCLF